MKILIGCEESQAVTIEMRKRGHEAFSCDIQECSGGHPEWHIKGDVLKPLWGEKWDLVVAHPPCTRLTNSGVRWLVSVKPRQGYEWNETAKRYVNTDPKIWSGFYAACKFFNQFTLYGKLGNKIGIENPIPHSYAKEELNAEYSQIIQPWQHGHMETKATCLWLFGLPPLRPTNNVYAEMMQLSKAERSKVHYASPGPDRAKIRSKTYEGIARAMAEQWTPDLRKTKG